MCGRFSDHLPKITEWGNLIGDWPVDFKPSYNRAPTSQIAAFRTDVGEMMRWGLIPSWSKSFDSRYATFNARIETVENKPTFRSAWSKSQRCLIPMAGYYEWLELKGKKQPFYITDKAIGGLLVAGLYECWGEGDQLSCSILTMPAQAMLAKVHSRMPIILTPESADAWLYNSIDVADITLPDTVFYPVGKAVGSVNNDYAELIDSIKI